MQEEIARIKEAYKRRSKKIPSQLYSYFTPSALFIIQQREKAIIAILKKNGIFTLADKLILDIGCGNGATLRGFIQYNARQKNYME
jgi:SAM-dependent methyltransferase